MKKHLADGYDVPHFFRDLMAMLTEVSEEEWGISKDPSQEEKDKSLRSYAKRGLPKKLYSYEKSTVALLPRVLDEMENGQVSVGEVYLSMKRSLKNPTDFLSAMDCLYALRAIDMNDDGEIFICLKQ